jgi:XTP/dITP diphosphohydrolase
MTQLSEVLLASQNEGKIREFQGQLNSVIRLMGFQDRAPGLQLPEETGKTYRENAYLKAASIASALQMPALADDSGFEVEALQNQPGLYSARFGGDITDLERCDLILQRMRGETNRKAQFVCVLCLVIPNNSKNFYFEGRVRGEVLLEKRGQSGFGYDPIFLPTGESQSFAELALERKMKISHRHLAIEAMLATTPDWISFVTSAAQSEVDRLLVDPVEDSSQKI